MRVGMWGGRQGRALMGERDRWMMAVQARLERVITAQDLSPVLEKTAITEARELARTLTDDPGSLPAMYLLGWLHWYRYQALPEGQRPARPAGRGDHVHLLLHQRDEWLARTACFPFWPTRQPPPPQNC